MSATVIMDVVFKGLHSLLACQLLTGTAGKPLIVALSFPVSRLSKNCLLDCKIESLETPHAPFGGCGQGQPAKANRGARASPHPSQRAQRLAGVYGLQIHAGKTCLQRRGVRCRRTKSFELAANRCSRPIGWTTRKVDAACTQ